MKEVRSVRGRQVSTWSLKTGERAGQAFSPFKRDATPRDDNNVIPLFGRKAAQPSLAKAA